MNLHFPIHTKQLGIMVTIAATGLILGSLFSIGSSRADEGDVVPSPSPSPTVAQRQSITEPSPSPKVISLAPSPSPSPATTAATKAAIKTSPQSAQPATKRAFHWGATVQPFPFAENNEQFLPEQFRLANELGLTTVRVEYSVEVPAMNKQAIDLAKQYGMQLVFIIPFGPNDIFSDKNLYSNAHKYVSDIVGQYKGQVPVWQLATEAASVALIDGGHHGVDRVDYPEAKYQAVATWLKAASTAVKESDPAAKRLINDQWVHVGFFDRFLAEGGDFDILGWNWFSDMGTDWNRPLLNSKTGQRYELMKKLKSFNKEIWLTEVNRRRGSAEAGEKAQADYIQTMAEKAYADSAIKAFFVFNLVEDQEAPPQEKGYGLVHADKSKQWTAGPKEAFGRYQALIEAKK